MLESIGAFVGLVGLLWFIFGMVKPGKALPYGSPSRWKVAGVAFLVMAVGNGIKGADPDYAAAQVIEKQAKSEERAAKAEQQATEEAEAEANQKPDLELVSYDHESAKYGNGAIVGIVKNNSSKDYNYVQNTFELFDDDGNTIGTAMANVAGLRSGATWKYRAGILRKGMAEYRPQKLTGY